MRNNLNKIRGTIIRITSYSRQEGIQFNLRLSDHPTNNLTINLMDSCRSGIIPCTGEIWNITCTSEPNIYFEDILEASAANISAPIGNEIIPFLGNNPKFPGIREKTSEKLWRIFGEDIYEILHKRNKKLLTSKVRLSAPITESLFNTWQQYEELIKVSCFFEKIKFPVHHSYKAIALWGRQTLKLISDDPYRLLSLDTWEQVDSSAKSLKKGKVIYKQRCAAVIEASMYEAYDENHTAQTYTELIKRSSRFLGPKISPEDAIYTAIADGRIVQFKQGDQLFFQTAWMHAAEQFIKNRLKGLTEDLKGNCKNKTDYHAGNKVIREILKQPVALIVGGSLRTKAETLTEIYPELPVNSSIIQVSFSKTTADELYRLTNQPTITMVDLLNFLQHTDLPDYSVLFINEAQEIDVQIFHKICTALTDRSRLYLIGDIHQLPPNGPGLIFHIWVKEHFFTTTFLDNPSDERAHPVKVMDEPLLPSIPDFDTKVPPTKGTYLHKTESNDLLNESLYIFRILCQFGSVQFITDSEKLCGKLNLSLQHENAALREYRKQTAQSLPSPNGPLFLGDQLLYKGPSDLTKGLLRGSIVTLTRVYRSPKPAVHENGEIKMYIGEVEINNNTSIQLTENDIVDYELGYALMHYNTSGNSWKYGVLVTNNYDSSSPYNDKRWLYTSIKKSVETTVIVGPKKLSFSNSNSPEYSNQLSRITGIYIND